MSQDDLQSMQREYQNLLTKPSEAAQRFYREVVAAHPELPKLFVQTGLAFPMRLMQQHWVREEAPPSPTPTIEPNWDGMMQQMSRWGVEEVFGATIQSAAVAFLMGNTKTDLSEEVQQAWAKGINQFLQLHEVTKRTLEQAEQAQQATSAVPETESGSTSAAGEAVAVDDWLAQGMQMALQLPMQWTTAFTGLAAHLAGNASAQLVQGATAADPAATQPAADPSVPVQDVAVVAEVVAPTSRKRRTRSDAAPAATAEAKKVASKATAAEVGAPGEKTSATRRTRTRKV